MKLVILNALGSEIVYRCLESFFNTIPEDINHEIVIIPEDGFRERTLNRAIKYCGTEEDILLVGDDILFTPGWYKALQKNYEKADILGMSMLYPDSHIIQDRGYDLIKIDDTITLEARDRGVATNSVQPFNFRLCDSLCGCFMYVKSPVFQWVPEFKEEGKNRLGEFIFLCQARQKGARIGVIDHYLYHDGKSTKANRDRTLSSISYYFEKPIWEGIVQKYISVENIKYHFKREISPELRQLLELPCGDILIYGIGTVTEFLCKNLKINFNRITFCSGLIEEAGLEFLGKQVKFIENISIKNFQAILITPLYRERKIFKEFIAPKLNGITSPIIYFVEQKKQSNLLIYNLRKLKVE